MRRNGSSTSRLRAPTLSLCLLALLSGCAIRPLPEDITPDHKNTYDIAMRIRCEMRQAVYKEFMGLLDDGDNGVPPDVVEKFKYGGPSSVLTGDYSRVPEELLKELALYSNSAVTYDFQFEISIQNKIDAGITLGDTIFNRTFSGVLSGKNDRTRYNIRNFRLEDNSLSLFHPHMTEYCDKKKDINSKNPSEYGNTPDYQYPIVGSLDLKELVHTYLRFSRDQLLRKMANAPQEFADQIKFRTELESTVSPTLEAGEPSRVLRLVKVNGGVLNNRTDLHIVTIGIAARDPAAPTKEASSAKPSKATTAQGGTKRPASPSKTPASQGLVSPEAAAKASNDANRAVDRLLLRQNDLRLRDRLDRLDDFLD